MPCDTIQRTTVDLSVADINILQAGLEADGHTVNRINDHVIEWGSYSNRYRYDSASRKLRAPIGTNANEFKMSYSREVVRKTSKRFGWTLTAEQPNVFLANKRF
jgi:hypothetical protein